VCKIYDTPQSEHETQTQARQQKERPVNDTIERIDKEEVEIIHSGCRALLFDFNPFGYLGLQPLSAAVLVRDLLAGNAISTRWAYSAPYRGGFKASYGPRKSGTIACRPPS